MPSKIEITLNVEVDVFTAGSAAEVVKAILECLLYHRNQIPFVYETYKYYVNKWYEEEYVCQHNSHGMGGGLNFHIQRKRDQAKNTKRAISLLREAIGDVFERYSVKCLRFLFGATAFTPKEAYTINIPPNVVSTNHCYYHHRLSPTKLNQSLLSMLTSTELYTIFSNNLQTTNIYMEVEAVELPSSSSLSSVQPSPVFPKEFVSLPLSCKDIQIHLFPKFNEKFDDKQLKCCKELTIFDDIINLNIGIGDIYTSTTKDKVEGTKTKQSLWWESEVVVRGFKYQPIKGINLWS